MQGTKWLTVAAAAGLMLVGACATENEKRVTSVPPAAQKAFDQYAEGGAIQKMEMEKEHGIMFYEAEVKKTDGSKIKITVSADGKLYKLERKDCKHE